MSLKLYILMLSMLWIPFMEFSSKKLSISNSSIPDPQNSLKTTVKTLEFLLSRFHFSRLLQWLLLLVDAKEENLSWLFFFWFLPFFSFFKSLLMAKESLWFVLTLFLCRRGGWLWMWSVVFRRFRKFGICLLVGWDFVICVDVLISSEAFL